MDKGALMPRPKPEQVNTSRPDIIMQGTTTDYMGFQIFLAIPTKSNVNPKMVAAMFDRVTAEMIRDANRAEIIPKLVDMTRITHGN